MENPIPMQITITTLGNKLPLPFEKFSIAEFLATITL